VGALKRANPEVHFAQYLALLKMFCPAVNGLIVFDQDASQIWQDCDQPIDQDQLPSLLPNFLRADIDSHVQNLPNGEIVELIKLRQQAFDLPLVLAVSTGNKSRSSIRQIASEPAFTRLSEMLLADYCQNIRLAAREAELTEMADELSRRYDELNLVYKAEDQAVNLHHGRDLLRQLVMNSASFLKVDVVYLYIAGKDIAMHKYRNDNPVFHASDLFETMRAKVYPLLMQEVSPMVVNNPGERRQRDIDPDLPFKFVACPVINAEGATIGLLATASQDFAAGDFSDSDRNLLEVMSKKASKIVQSHFDPLTGLENSHSFELILKDLLRKSCDRGVSHAIANIDIDRLAVVNDISGREAGNELIRMVAQKMTEMVRAHDLVARLGSDKFGILLKNCDLMTARVIMKKVSHAVSSLYLEWEGRRHEVSISIGVAPIGRETLSVSTLLDEAETARNVSKQRGRNNIHVLEVKDSNLLQRKEEIRWVGQIQDALRDGRFQLHAQLIEPINATASHPHYEILLRLLDNDGQTVLPGSFIPAAESFYLMANLDLWVINQAFQELSEMYRDSSRQRLQVSINLSGQSLNNPYTLASYIENKLEEYRLDGHDICFEITESAAIANLAEASGFIEQMRELGCKFALDDFGTGLSSFSYLKNLNVDYLKIDGSFVRDIVADPVSESMVSAISQVGQAMRLETVAEYVENEEIRQKLVEIGVDYGQGYGIGKPMLFKDIRAVMAKSA
jgi:diguanylate cyclase (GGDEF)-like protein